MAHLISVNVGLPRKVAVEGSGKKAVLSAIVKEPVKSPVAVGKLNLDGDQQADPRVHGGVNKAVYAYPSEHYGYWRKIFPQMEFPWGTFGENLTTKGLLEKSLHVGDQFEIGSAAFEVTQPRFPCFKLAIRFGTDDMIKLFLDSERTGFYLKVLKVGKVKAGDSIKRTRTDHNSETITSIVARTKK
jgi:MOSC domain-containing protein YiiM